MELKTMGKEEYEEVTSQTNYWKPKIGEEITGEVTKRYDGKYGSQWLIQTEDGTEWSTPSHKYLQARLERVKIGDKVQIRYERNDPPKARGENPMAVYRVWIKK